MCTHNTRIRHTNKIARVAIAMAMPIVTAVFACMGLLGESYAQAQAQTKDAYMGDFVVRGGTSPTNFEYSEDMLTVHSGDLSILTPHITDEQIYIDGACTITLAGVNIDTNVLTTSGATGANITVGSPIKIEDNADFDVTLVLAKNTENVLFAKQGNLANDDLGCPAIEKNGDTGGALTITGAGTLKATGGNAKAGIGSGLNKAASNIRITGGALEVTGGASAAAIGAGKGGRANNNTICGNAVVSALLTKGDEPHTALEGFENGIKQGIVFEGTAGKDPSWSEWGQMAGNVELLQNATFPTSLCVASNQTLFVTAGHTCTLLGTLLNEGTVSDQGNLVPFGQGRVVTRVEFVDASLDPQQTYSRDVVYLDATGERLTYGELPATKGGWFYKAQDGSVVRVSSATAVELNVHHMFAGETEGGWHISDDGWYYTQNGLEATGWQWIDDAYGAHWYYFEEDGIMASHVWIWDGAWYWLCDSGAMITNLWQWIDGAWYGFWWNGQMCQGWVWDADYVAWFYCYDNGAMAKDTWVDGYYLSDSGVCL